MITYSTGLDPIEIGSLVSKVKVMVMTLLFTFYLFKFYLSISTSRSSINDEIKNVALLCFLVLLCTNIMKFHSVMLSLLCHNQQYNSSLFELTAPHKPTNESIGYKFDQSSKS